MHLIVPHGDKALENFAEEIADTEFLIDQIRHYYPNGTAKLLMRSSRGSLLERVAQASSTLSMVSIDFANKESSLYDLIGTIDHLEKILEETRKTYGNAELIEIARRNKEKHMVHILTSAPPVTVLTSQPFRKL